MQLNLSADEAGTLRELVSTALSELHTEIHHTDTPEFRERLLWREETLRRLVERLGGDGDPVATQSPQG